MFKIHCSVSHVWSGVTAHFELLSDAPCRSSRALCLKSETQRQQAVAFEGRGCGGSPPPITVSPLDRPATLESSDEAKWGFSGGGFVGHRVNSRSSQRGRQGVERSPDDDAGQLNSPNGAV